MRTYEQTRQERLNALHVSRQLNKQFAKLSAELVKQCKFTEWRNSCEGKAFMLEMEKADREYKRLSNTNAMLNEKFLKLVEQGGMK